MCLTRWFQTDEAIAYIKQQAGTHLDPDCVDAFLQRIDVIKQIQADYADEPGDEIISNG